MSMDTDQDLKTDDDFAAEWAAMIEDEPEEDKSDFNSLLNLEVLTQEGIDSVIGYKFDPQAVGARTGVGVLANTDMVSQERLPLLEIIYDRLVRLMTTSLRNLTSESIEVSLESIEPVRLGDYLSQICLPAVISVFRAEEWDHMGIMSIEADLMYSMVDILLGGRRMKPPVARDLRPYTTIEMNLVERMCRLILMDAEQAFKPVSEVSFSHIRMENDPRFATIGRPTDSGVLARFRLDMENRGGYMEILIPHAMIEPIREQLSQLFMGESVGKDTIWQDHLTAEIQESNIEVEAILAEEWLSLGQMLNLKVGDTLELQVQKEDLVEIRCGSTHVAKGGVGQQNNNIAIALDQKPKITTKNLANIQKS